MKLRVAAYCPVSKAKDEQLESLDAQKEHYKNYIKGNSEWEFVGVYYDAGICSKDINWFLGIKWC